MTTSVPLLVPTSYVGFAKEVINPTGSVTINQVGASIAVASTTGWPSAGTLIAVTAAGAAKLVTYTGTDATHFTGCTVAAGSLAVATTTAIYNQGTAMAAPTVYIPATVITPEDLRERIRDESYDNDANILRAVYDGVQDATLDVEGWAYGDTFGHILAATGLLDVISGGGPYVHTLKFSSDATVNQPPSYTIFDFDGYECRAWSGCVLDTLDIKVDAKGAIHYTAKYKGWKSAAATLPTSSFSAVAPFLGWETAVSIGGVTTDRVLELEYSLKRSADGIHTLNGVQTPTVVMAGGRDASVKAKMLFRDNTDLTAFYNNTQDALVATITQPSSGPILAITTTKVARTKAALDRSATYFGLDMDVDCISNATDVGPLAVVLTNSIASAF